jgi:hypothetical protein
MAAVAVATVVGAAAFLMLVLKLFAVAAILAGAWVVLIAVVALLMRGADPEQLTERSQANQRWMDVATRPVAPSRRSQPTKSARGCRATSRLAESSLQATKSSH